MLRYQAFVRVLEFLFDWWEVFETDDHRVIVVIIVVVEIGLFADNVRINTSLFVVDAPEK
jgi:hypothetical protein